VGILHRRGKLEGRIFRLIHKGRSKMTRTHPLIAAGILALFLSASALMCSTSIVEARGGEQTEAKDHKNAQADAFRPVFPKIQAVPSDKAQAAFCAVFTMPQPPDKPKADAFRATL
jgi:hypothetical protein